MALSVDPFAVRLLPIRNPASDRQPGTRIQKTPKLERTNHSARGAGLDDRHTLWYVHRR